MFVTFIMPRKSLGIDGIPQEWQYAEGVVVPVADTAVPAFHTPALFVEEPL